MQCSLFICKLVDTGSLDGVRYIDIDISVKTSDI